MPATHPRSFPVHTANDVPLIEQRVIHSGEQRILKQGPALQTLLLQHQILLPLKGLHRGEHPSSCSYSGDQMK